MFDFFWEIKKRGDFRESWEIGRTAVMVFRERFGNLCRFS
jgi:hypothetical protein